MYKSSIIGTLFAILVGACDTGISVVHWQSQCFELEAGANELAALLKAEKIPVEVNQNDKKTTTTSKVKGVERSTTEVTPFYCTSWPQEHNDRAMALYRSLSASDDI